MSPKAENRCPLCKHPTAPEHAPFCSRRCKDRDLLNWLGGGYAVPVTDDTTEQDSGWSSDE